MRFLQSEIPEVWLVELEPILDERGYFARSFCDREFAGHDLETQFVQSSTAFTRAAGTLRGLHFQLDPHWETKLVRCTRGAAYVVAVDLRQDSKTHRRWVGVELNEGNGRAIYVPAGFAQGYQTLVDDTELLYQMNKHFHPESAKGYRYDDPAFGIEWPQKPTQVSSKDLAWEKYVS